jgi:hypothetical protein
MQQLLLTAPLPVRRSLYIALGKLGTKLDTVPEWIFEATSVTPDVHTNPYLFEAHVRAAEMPPGWATELMIGNLEVALFDVNPEPQERVRLKKFVVATAEQMRTRELAGFLNKVIGDEKDCLSTRPRRTGHSCRRHRDLARKAPAGVRRSATSRLGHAGQSGYVQARAAYRRRQGTRRRRKTRSNPQAERPGGTRTSPRSGEARRN